MKATINRPPPVEQPPAVVTLEMSEREAEVLRSIVGHIQRSGYGFVGMTLSRLYQELGRVGVVLQTHKAIEGASVVGDGSWPGT